MTECIGPRCTAKAVQRHHVIEQAELKRVWRSAKRREEKLTWPTLRALLDDERNLAGVCVRTHERHTSRFDELPLWCLPDSAFEFARELLGPGAAFEYLRRAYRDGDPRLDALRREHELRSQQIDALNAALLSP